MTDLRQCGPLRVTAKVFAASALSAAALGWALLLPGMAVAAPHSHARRPLPTALHNTSVSESSLRGSANAPGKRRKGALKSKTKAESSSEAGRSGAGSGRRDKGNKSGKPRAQPAQDLVPMYRAGREAGRGSRGLAARDVGPRGQRRYWNSANGPAPLVGPGRRGAGRTVAPPRVWELARRSSSPAWRSEASGGSMASAGHARPVPPAMTASRRSVPERAAAPALGGTYAEGVSHPDDDESQPRTAAGEAARAADEGPAPVVRVSAAPSNTVTLAPAKPQVVQGFGGEVALAGPDTTDRPGGTRRRNHPANWSDPAAAPPEALEDREAVTEAAVSPSVLPEIYDRSGHVVMPAPLKGSHDVLVHQNMMATSDGLERIYDDADLERLRAAHLLVSLPQSESLRVNPDLPANRRVARPWTVMFAGDLAREFYQRFGQPLTVTSAVRTVHFQARLQMVNGNAAATAGEAASPHLTGQALDFGKHGMSAAELAWMRDYLLPLMRAGKIDVEEEFQQSCFHISVYRSYTMGRRVVHEVAQTRPSVAGEARAEAPEER